MEREWEKSLTQRAQRHRVFYVHRGELALAGEDTETGKGCQRGGAISN